MLLNFGSVVFGQENIKGTRIVTAEDTPALINRALIAGISEYINIGDLETKTIRQNGFLLSYDSPKACYMASLCSLTGKNKEGLEWQERVFEKGFNQFEYLQSDPGMAGLRGTQGYESIIKKYTHPR
jgi:uncharacterized protein YaeQ